MPDQGGETPKIQIDSDWKAQAQAEKEQLRAQEEKAKSQGGGAAGKSSSAAQGEFPPASWDTLLGSLVSQSMMYLGAYADPRTGMPIIELEAARHYIDLLGVLEEKTKGNLEEEEAKNLATVIYELRMRYVQIAQAAASGGLAGPAGGPAQAAGASGPSTISGEGASNIGGV